MKSEDFEQGFSIVMSLFYGLNSGLAVYLQLDKSSILQEVTGMFFSIAIFLIVSIFFYEIWRESTGDEEDEQLSEARLEEVKEDRTIKIRVEDGE